MKKKRLSVLLSVVLLLSVLLSTAAYAQAGDTYDADTVYYAGDTVIYNGTGYTAKWYNKGTAPDTPDAPWERTPEYDENGVPIWYEGMACPGGGKVSYNGAVYEAKWWTTSVPGSDNSWKAVSGQETPDTPDNPDIPDTPDVPDTPDTPDVPDVPSDPNAWDAGKVYFNGDKVVYNGINYTAKYYNVGVEPGTTNAWEKDTEYDENGIPIWYEGMVCHGGSKVSHNGTVYEAKWWTNTEPGTDSSWKGPGGDVPGPPAPDPSVPGGDTEPSDPDGPVQYYSDYTVDSSLVSPGSSEFRTVGYFPFYSVI